MNRIIRLSHTTTSTRTVQASHRVFSSSSRVAQQHQPQLQHPVPLPIPSTTLAPSRFTGMTASHSTQASFRYIDPASIIAGKKPWAKVDTGEGRSFSRVDISRPVYDAGPRADEFRNVDSTGFAFHTYPSEIDAKAVLADGPVVRGDYYAEVERALRDKLVDGDKIKRVIIFDHTIRGSGSHGCTTAGAVRSCGSDPRSSRGEGAETRG
jgi:hypothetical protein